MEQQYGTRGDTSVALGAGGDQDGQDQSLCAGNWGPWKRTPNVVQRDADDTPTPTVLTDRDVIACFNLKGGSGKVLVSSIERYHGPLSGEIAIGLWSMTQAADS